MFAQARRSQAGPQTSKNRIKGAASSPKGRAGGLVFSAALGLLLMSAGCAKNTTTQEVCRPGDLGRCIVEDVDYIDTEEIDDADIQGKIATTPTSHLLFGAFRHVPVLSILDAASVEYERFDRFVLERDLARIERYYRARGFYEAHARAGRVTKRADGRVRVEIAVDEGKPVTIGRVDLKWKDWDLERAKNITKYVTEEKNELRIGARFEEEAYELTKDRIRRAMADRGFAYAKVEGKAYVDLVKHEAQVIYEIEMGPHCTFGDIKLIGMGELPEGPLRNAIDIKKGEEFSTAALTSAEIALADFGVFGAVDVRPELSPEGSPPNPVVPVTFELQVAPLSAVKAGFGAEVGSIVEAHAIGGWENRNFLGGLRRLTVEARPGLVFYPWTITKIFTDSLETVLPQLRLRFDIRQPIPFDTRTSARLGGEFNLYTPPVGDEDKSIQYILGYQTYSGIFGFDRPFFDSRVHLGLFYNIEYNNPFSYNEFDIPEGFDTVLIPSLQAIASLDLRRDAQGRPDAVEPNKGFYVKTDLQFAGRFLGGDADDIRITPEFRGYIPISSKVTLAFRVATGFILAEDYQKEDPQKEDDEGTCADDLEGPRCNEAQQARTVQIRELRGYFSGGANSNRGYSYRGVGPHARVQSLYLANGIAPDGPGEPIAIGGLTLWETSTELRFPIALPLGGVLFLDASDVTYKSGGLRLKPSEEGFRPHLSAGFGLRYATPVGPARLDIGYRIPCAQVFGVCKEADFPADEGTPEKLGGVVPIAVSLAIGEAF
jgi:outer membrane protein insertion porin family/translocation and assembly module TamA